MKAGHVRNINRTIMLSLSCNCISILDFLFYDGERNDVIFNPDSQIQQYLNTQYFFRFFPRLYKLNAISIGILQSIVSQTF